MAARMPAAKYGLFPPFLIGEPPANLTRHVAGFVAMKTAESGAQPYPHPLPRPEWLALRQEPVIDPEQRIIDAHHHLWTRPGELYLLEDLLHDTDAGHNIVGSVFVQCGWSYRTAGPAELRPVGETEAVVALLASRPGVSLCQAIVGYADLRLGDGVVPVLQAHAIAGRGRFRGIRQSTAADPAVISTMTAIPPPGLMQDAGFRRGFDQLGKLGLSYDAWLYHPQLGELIDLLRAFPEAPVVLNHVGGLIPIGPHRERAEESWAAWRADLRRLARFPNVFVKLGGLARTVVGFDFHTWPEPPDSATLASLWRPFIEPCIEAFGPNRCMFESNFPVDKGLCGYVPMWNAFKRVVQDYPANERDLLFHGAAQRFYRLSQAT